MLANLIKIISLDAIEKSCSGHPGMVLGMADIAAELWHKHLKHAPTSPTWFNRDRFVLCNGHGSMLLYSLLHITGYDLSMEEIKNFRQQDSKTPGHPEYGHTIGVETTTGPLGQGLSNAVGFALAEKLLANKYNTSDYKIVDHYTYCFVGDGSLMEGISHESCSFAGKQELNKLIVFYDANNITIDGDLDLSCTTDQLQRFRSYNWNVIGPIDGHKAADIEKAIIQAKASDKPSIIICNTIIGKGLKQLEGTSKIHGAPAGAEAIQEFKATINWQEPEFSIPKKYYDQYNHTVQGSLEVENWNKLLAEYKKNEPLLAAEFIDYYINKKQPEEILDDYALTLATETSAYATRKTSNLVLNKLASSMPNIVGGSADLTPSNLTQTNTDSFYIRYGIREFAMAGIMNGIALHSNLVPYGGTFLVFSDYCKNAIRMSALMKLKVIYIFTHDSVGVGEDGPTHQPVEQIGALRAIPGLKVFRPADLIETIASYKLALKHNGPSAIICSRQKLAWIARDSFSLEVFERGASIVFDSDSFSKVILATGSEVAEAISIARSSKEKLRVISVLCLEIFAMHLKAFIPEGVEVYAFEASNDHSWYKYISSPDNFIGIQDFGFSAPGGSLLEQLLYKEAKKVLL